MLIISIAPRHQTWPRAARRAALAGGRNAVRSGPMTSTRCPLVHGALVRMVRPALLRPRQGQGRARPPLVYKVDRLTRSLSDFVKIVDALDAKGASFVSVTQQFNTSTSMGRLTLNMLLSFAQF